MPNRSFADRLLTRAARLPGIGAGLGMSIDPTGGAGPKGRKGQVMGATRAINYNSPGQPLPLDIASDQVATQNYLGSVFVMRCARTLAETIAGLPFVAGMDPMEPSNYNENAVLARLLGPASPQAPGGPNPHLTSRAIWVWTIIQYILTGRFAWEKQYDGMAGKSDVIGLWPLISKALAPVPLDGKTDLWGGFQYQTPTGVIPMDVAKVLYCWRPSVDDWRMPESSLQSAAIPIAIQRAIDQYHYNLLKNGLVATHIVVTPPFEEADQRRSWEDQFLAEFTGVDKVGNTIFGYVDLEEGDNPNARPIQVEPIATTPVDAQLMERLQQAKIDITIALGVPESLVGNASQRIYANADSEYRNFWTLTVLNLIAELQDHINLRLAPQLGPEVGWFDLSKIAALQPPSIFAPPDVAEAINMGIVTADQAADLLGIPPAGQGDDSDVETVMVGEESTSTGAGMGSGGRGVRSVTIAGRRFEIDGRPWVPIRTNVPMRMNSYVYERGYRPKLPERERIVVRTSGHRRSDGAGFDRAEKICERVEHLRSVAHAKRLTDTVKRGLAKHYPGAVLDWVDDADWSGPKDVSLDDVQMARRPGGRDMAKVNGIASAVADGKPMDPVVLVKTPSGKLKIADGYHRTLGHKRAGKKSISAYVGEVDDEEGPWDREMHDAKRNRAGWWVPSSAGQPPAIPPTIDPKSILEGNADTYDEEDEDAWNGVDDEYVDDVAQRIHAAAAGASH